MHGNPYCAGVTGRCCTLDIGRAGVCMIWDIKNLFADGVHPKQALKKVNNKLKSITIIIGIHKLQIHTECHIWKIFGAKIII